MAERLPPKKPGFGMMSKNLMFWPLIFLVGLVLWNALGNRREEFTDVPYSMFASELERNNIARVEITNGKTIEGDFKQSVPYQSRDVVQFSTILPIQDSEILLERIEQQNIPISAKEPKESFGTLLFGLLPWVILIGLWIFFFRGNTDMSYCAWNRWNRERGLFLRMALLAA